MTPHLTVWFEFPTLSGGERSMLAVLERLDGFRVSALVPEPSPLANRLREIGVRTLPFSIHSDRGKLAPEAALEFLRSTIERERTDLLHANSLSLSRFTGAVRNQLPIPCSGHLRDIMKLSERARKHLLGNDRLVAVSQATKAAYVPEGPDVDRVCVILNGIDLETFSPGPPTGFLHRELSLPETARLIGTIGQICLRKGQDLLPEVAAALVKQAHDVHFCLIGERYSAKAESVRFDEQIELEFQRLGLADRLHRLGHRADVSRLLREFAALFHPARQEPLGRVLLEAAASGCPVVATDVGGTPEIFTAGESALLFSADDAESGTASLAAILNDEALSKRLSSRARGEIETRFEIGQSVAKLQAFWQALLAPT